MPRPDKPISPGRLDSEAPSSRSHRWSKRGGPETADAHRGAPSTLDVVVDDITVTVTDEPESASKYSHRASSAHIPEPDITPEPTEPIHEWVSDRVIVGRIYRRTDALVEVKVHNL
ncbi:MAG: hypothetical protein ACR2N7_08970 [Acidimicrobiia bacterium]